MIKKLFFIAVLVMVEIFIITGCTKDPLTLFTKSIEKTATIEKLTQTVNFEISLEAKDIASGQKDFEAQLQAQLAALFSNITGSINMKYDRTSQAMVGDGNIGLGGIGLNAKLFMKDKKFVMQLPMFPKYLTMDISKYEELAKGDSREDKELASKLLEILKNSLSKDRITLTEAKKINPGSGEVETTELTLNLTSDEIKAALNQIIDSVYTNPTMRGYIIENLKKNPEFQGSSDTDLSIKLDEELNRSKEKIKNIEFKDFVYIVNIDKNLYIIQDRVSFTVQGTSSGANPGTSTFNFVIKRTDIGKDVNFDMPALDSNNSVNIEDLGGQDMFQPTF